MKNYENSDIYKASFNLAINVYRLNMILPRQLLLKYGNRLRRTSVKIKDLIIESYTVRENRQHALRLLKEAARANDEALILLQKIKDARFKEKKVNELIRAYIKLKNKLITEMGDIESNSPVLSIPYNNNVLV